MLAREYADQALFIRCHRLTVDAYAVQHRGEAGDPRADRSVWLHFLALDAVVARGVTHERALAELRGLTGSTFPPLPADWPVFGVTLADVTAADHADTVARWAASAHAIWAPLLLPLVGRKP